MSERADHMQGVLAGAALRAAAGLGLVAAVVIIAVAAGSAGVFGAFGSLFAGDGESLQVAESGPANALLAAPSAADQAEREVLRRRPVEPAPSRPQARTRTPGRMPASGTPPASQPPPSSGPVPDTPQPPAPPAPPRGGPVVNTLGQTVKDVLQQAPPAAQPIAKPIADAIDTVRQTCAQLPICP